MISKERLDSVVQGWNKDKVLDLYRRMEKEEPELNLFLNKQAQAIIDEYGQEAAKQVGWCFNLIAIVYQLISVPKGIN